MTPSDIIARASIVDVWRRLGGGPLRHGRGKGFWRDGSGFNVSLGDAKGVWFDHARAEGGGTLDLIQTATGCDRREALRWLADSLGLALDSHQFTPSERRQWAEDDDERSRLLKG